MLFYHGKAKIIKDFLFQQKIFFFVLNYYFCIMEAKKLRRGPKPKDPKEKKIMVPIWVQAKFKDAAKLDALNIERKYANARG